VKLIRFERSKEGEVMVRIIDLLLHFLRTSKELVSKHVQAFDGICCENEIMLPSFLKSLISTSLNLSRSVPALMFVRISQKCIRIPWNAYV
jgi:hypothetical protein